MSPAEPPSLAADRRSLPGGLGLSCGFLDPLPAARAVAAVRALERAGIETVWLQEYSGVDPFVRAALYLQATERLRIALGVATILARDPEATVAVASTLEEAFPGRFVLGLGVSHRHLAEARGHVFGPPIATMRAYLAALEAARGARRLPPRILAALGPRMVELAAARTSGIHTYFSPVEHTAAVRAAVGPSPWLAPSQMVALGRSDAGWRDGARQYLQLCLGMPNYRRNLQRFGFTEAGLEPSNDALVDALVVPDQPSAFRARIDAQRTAGADHVVVQFVPPPSAEKILERLAAGLSGAGPA